LAWNENSMCSSGATCLPRVLV